MSETRTINVYCDESCYLESDGIDVMVLGSLRCETKNMRKISNDIRAIKDKHGLSKRFEIKWTKVSPAKSAFYLDLIEYFLTEDTLRFRALVVPDKSILNHEQFEQTHDDWYYKMYYLLLKYVVHPPHKYNFYLDIKDSHGGKRTSKLQEVLANTLHDFNNESIVRVQQIRSEESEILQLADLLIGAISYANRRLDSSATKLAILARLHKEFGDGYLRRTSAFARVKFNVFLWDAQRGDV